jgi:hypothetical protein
MRTERRLASLSERLAAARRDLEIAREQLSYLDEVAEEAKVRMLVSATPLADRDYRERRDDLERVRRHHDSLKSEVEELSAEQDRLLDLLLKEAIG